MTQTAAVLECDLQAAGADLQRAVLANLTGRRSIRRYLPRPLAEAEVEEILHAIVWAPSAHNRQPVRVIRLEAMPWKTRLAQAMGERLRADRLRDGDCAELVEQDVRRSFARITGAPLVLVLCMDMSPTDHYPDARRQNAERAMAAQSVAAAAQNGLLAAHALGLGACWMCGPLFCPQAVVEALNAPRHWEPQLLLTIGHPANGGKPPSRHAAETMVWRPD